MAAAAGRGRGGRHVVTGARGVLRKVALWRAVNANANPHRTTLVAISRGNTRMDTRPLCYGECAASPFPCGLEAPSSDGAGRCVGCGRYANPVCGGTRAADGRRHPLCQLSDEQRKRLERRMHDAE